MMKTRTVHLPSGDLSPGMIVASPVSGPQGAVLLNAGTVLDESMLEHLRRRGIESVSVIVPDGRDPDIVAREIAEACARVDHLFRNGGSAARQALHAVVRDYRRRQAE